VAWRSETLSPSPEESLEEVLAGLLDRRPAGIAW